jgi:hypothetical protein
MKEWWRSDQAENAPDPDNHSEAELYAPTWKAA